MVEWSFEKVAVNMMQLVIMCEILHNLGKEFEYLRNILSERIDINPFASGLIYFFRTP